MERYWLPSALKDWCVLFLPGVVNGTTAYDASGNGNNGTLVNSPTPTRGGLWGYKGLKFNGSSQYISLWNPSSLNIEWDFTVSVQYTWDWANQWWTNDWWVIYDNFYGGSYYCLIRIEKASPYRIQFITGNRTIINSPWTNRIVWKQYALSFVLRWNNMEVWIDWFKEFEISSNDSQVKTPWNKFIWREDSSPYDYFHSGKLSNMHIASYALSPDKIRLYASTFFIP